MNYIEKVTIENFQSHLFTEIDFVNGLNVIVGPSDQGKTAVIRAIKWVLFNEPRGTEFIRHGTNNVKVTIEMSNKYKITRERTPSKNRYLVTNPEDETSIYEGFGNEVPEEVKKAHGIYKVLIDVDSSVSLNIGDQLESAFLLSTTNAVKAKAIGRLTGVHIIDNAVRDTLSDIKKENQLDSTIKKELGDVSEVLKEYTGLDKLQKMIENREKSISKLEEKIKLYNKITMLYDKLKDIEKMIFESTTFIEKYKNISNAEIGVLKCSEKIMILNKIKGIKNNLETNEKNIAFQKRLLSDMKDIGLVQKNINKLEQNYNRINTLKKTQNQLLEINTSIIKGNEYVKARTGTISEMKNKYKVILEKLGKCPVCFSNIDECKVHEIIDAV